MNLNDRMPVLVATIVISACLAALAVVLAVAFGLTDGRRPPSRVRVTDDDVTIRYVMRAMDLLQTIRTKDFQATRQDISSSIRFLVEIGAVDRIEIRYTKAGVFNRGIYDIELRAELPESIGQCVVMSLLSSGDLDDFFRGYGHCVLECHLVPGGAEHGWLPFDSGVWYVLGRWEEDLDCDAD